MQYVTNKIRFFVLVAVLMLVIAIIISLSEFKKTDIQDIQHAKDVYSLLEQGKWGWVIPNSTLSCEINPHSITFRDNFRKMIIKFDKEINSADGTKTSMAVYKLINKDRNRITLKMVGDKRIDNTGKGVVWDLVVLNQHEYAWHRHDWHVGALTPTIQLCSQ